MTPAALNALVFANQFKIRRIMIKCRLVQADDVIFAALMIRMTGFTFAILKARCPPVKTLFIRNILVDCLMAIQTQGVLVLTAKTFMTAATFRFVFGVPLYQLARHQQLLHRCSPGPG